MPLLRAHCFFTHRLQIHKFHFSTIFLLKMGLIILFTHYNFVCNSLWALVISFERFYPRYGVLWLLVNPCFSSKVGSSLILLLGLLVLSFCCYYLTVSYCYASQPDELLSSKIQSLCPTITGNVCCTEYQFNTLREQVQQVRFFFCLVCLFVFLAEIGHS